MTDYLDRNHKYRNRPFSNHNFNDFDLKTIELGKGRKFLVLQGENKTKKSEESGNSNGSEIESESESENDNENEIDNAIIDSFNNHKKRLIFGNNALNYFKKHHSNDKAFKKLVALF